MKGDYVKPIFVKSTIILGILFVNLVTAYAGETLQYELTHDKIMSARVSEIKNGLYEVSVELNGPATKAFARLTGDNIGKRLEIIFAGRILTSAIVQDRIDSGMIALGESKLEEAAKLIVEIMKPDKKGNIRNEKGDNRLIK